MKGAYGRRNFDTFLRLLD